MNRFFTKNYIWYFKR